MYRTKASRRYSRKPTLVHKCSINLVKTYQERSAQYEQIFFDIFYPTVLPILKILLKTPFESPGVL